VFAFRLCVASFDGLWFALAAQGHANLFQINPRAHESGFDVDRGLGGERVHVRLIFQVKGLSERRKAVDTGAGLARRGRRLVGFMD